MPTNEENTTTSILNPIKNKMNIYDAYAKKDIDIKNLRIRIKDLEISNKLLIQEKEYRKTRRKEIKRELKSRDENIRYYKKLLNKDKNKWVKPKAKETNSF